MIVCLTYSYPNASPPTYTVWRFSATYAIKASCPGSCVLNSFSTSNSSNNYPVTHSAVFAANPGYRVKEKL